MGSGISPLRSARSSSPVSEVRSTAFPSRRRPIRTGTCSSWSTCTHGGVVRRRTRPASGGRAALYNAAAPFATGGVYVNFMPDDESQRVRSGAYGPNYDRLAKIKAKYDPKNLFRMNQNVVPAAAR